MDLNTVLSYLHQYGHWIILLILFCGIVGIPAPEETFMVLLGILIAKHKLNFIESLTMAFLGTILGMLVAYGIGRKLGLLFIQKYGKYIRVTPDRFKYVESHFAKHGTISLLYGFFVPGLRQLNPYLAGMVKYSFFRYLALSLIGSLFWTSLFTSIGYFLGDRLPVSYLPVLAVVALLLFLVTFLRKRRSHAQGKDI
jgi:membrane-associated protein